MEKARALVVLVRCAGSQRKLAEIVGVSEEHVSRWMKGKYPIPEWVPALSETMERLPPEQWPDRWR